MGIDVIAILLLAIWDVQVMQYLYRVGVEMRADH